MNVIESDKLLSVIIPTMLKNTDILNKLIDELAEDNSVGEIIVIDNSTKGYSHQSDKVRVVVPSENLYVNPAWNLGVQSAKYTYFGILNDDLLIPKSLCSNVLEFISNDDNIGLVGLDSDSIDNSSIEEFSTYPQNTNIKFAKINKSLYTEYWGSAFFGKKSHYFEIPKNIKIWCGDNLQLKMNNDVGRQNYQIRNVQVKHLQSLTSDNKALFKAQVHLFFISSAFLISTEAIPAFIL